MTAPRYLSLFSGAGGIDLGLDNAGWSCVGQCEIDPWCRGVLARHWPNVTRYEDVRDVAHPDVDGGRGPVAGDGRGASPDGASRDARPRSLHAGIDLIAGGFPCQDVSVAGRRAGLAGERSGLWWEFHRIVESVRPRAVLVENVEGLLSSNGGRDLGSVVDALVELGYGVAWRVLDAQHFGVPQRRRRVFLLAITGGRVGAERAAEVLALTTSGSGDPAPRRGEGKGAPGGAGGGVAGTLRSHPRPGSNSNGAWVMTPPVLANALDRQGGGPDDNSAQANHLVPTIAHTLTKATASNGTGHAPDECTYVDRGQGVRRLTPRECERLMGWPDHHTRYTADGREVADSRRYAMCGNGVVSPVAEWIGVRLACELARDNEFESAA